MSTRTFCDCCDAPADQTSRTFKPDQRFELSVIFRPAGEPAGHVCDACLADMMMQSVESFSDSPVIASYRTAFKTATERDAYREECEALRAEKTELIKRAVKADDTIHALEKKLSAAEEQVGVQTTIARAAKAEADQRAKFAQAAQAQLAHEDPEYIKAVEAREKKRASGR